MMQDPWQSRHAINRLILILVLFAGLNGQAISEDPGGPAMDKTVSGVVFNDVNRNLNRDPGEKGVKGVLVSNQQAVVVTDRNVRVVNSNGAEWGSVYNSEFEPKVWEEWYNAHGKGFSFSDCLAIPKG